MKRNSHKRNTLFATLSALLCICLFTTSANAEDLLISDTPLFLTAAAAPNVFFEVDDSGSMDWEILTRKHWHFCAYDPAYASAENLGLDENCGWLVNNGLWNSYNLTGNAVNMSQKNYLYDNSDNVFNSNCNNTLESCNNNFTNNLGYQLDWRIFSSDFNTLAYNPTINYGPWQGPCSDNGDACIDASFSSAHSDPYVGSDGYNQTRSLENFIFEIWTDDKGYTGTRPTRGINHNDTAVPNNEVDIWDSHTRYTVSASTVLVETISYNPDNNVLNATITNSRQLSGDDCISELYPGDPEKCRTIAETRQNIANWYQYHRKRSFVAKNAIAAVVTDNPSYRYSLSVINRFNELFVQVPAGNSNLNGHNRDMLSELFSLNWPRSGTPLRLGLKRVGDYFDNALGDDYDDPITGSCQKNFAVLFTDGYWNGGNPGVENPDGDDHENTLADVARHYYQKDLSPLADQVPTDDFDGNEKQHMVTFGVAFGVEGNLRDTDIPPDGWPDDGNGNNLTESSIWGNPHNNTLAKIDDLWHAAYNSRGTFVAAKTASDVVGALENALQNIEKRSSSAAAVTLDSGIVGDNTNIYQTRFNSADWSGELRSIALDPLSGQLGDTNWLASESIPNWGERTILTHTGESVDDRGTAFRWDNLSTDQKDALRKGLSGDDVDIVAEERLEHLRGNTEKEQRFDGGTLRNRPNTVLGDSINSAPAHVGFPAFPYADSLENTNTDNNYSAFRQRYGFDGPLERRAMIYLGANDGMLHGFDVETGEEQLAYVPRAVYRNLSKLTDPNYNHRYYVDGTPTTGDAFIDTDNANGSNKSWHTVLVSGLNKGGQGIFALDITSPDTFSETNTSTVLWDFTDADDTDNDGDGDPDELDEDDENSMRHALGDTFSRPAIVRLRNGQWAAIFGNGYNNTREDGNFSNNGDAVLYILDLGTGEVIRKISTRRGRAEDPSAFVDENGITVSRQRANGLATPAPVDIDGDHIVDYIFAGDLFGNMWKFDLTKENTSEWDVAFYDGGNPAPLFSACANGCNNGLDYNQAITTRPEIGRTADRRGLMIYFGTGKYLSTSDTIDTSLQSFYGIANTGSRIFSRDQLQTQSIILEDSVSFGENSYGIRVTTNTPSSGGNGWYLDLLSPVNGLEGERVIQTPLLRNGRIIFTTLIPNQDVCGFGGSSWLMELSALSGSRLSVPPFDLTGDGLFNLADQVSLGGDGNSNSVPPSGLGFGEIISNPAVLNDGDKELKLLSGSSGDVTTIVESPAPDAFNRQSWRQLR